MKKVAFIVIGLAVFATGVGYALMASYLDTPRGDGEAVVFEVEAGRTLRPVLDQLAERGALDRPGWLYAYGRLSGQTDVKVGQYEALPSQSPRELLQMLGEGRIRTATFTIVPGLNRWQVRDQLAKEGWIKALEFDRLCDDKEFLAAQPVPGPTCDGYFFPETYTFARGVSAKEIFRAVLATYRMHYREVTSASGSGPLEFDERQFMTLASIVEKETGAPEERPRIACVFYNRLRAKPPWRLSTDPTVIYAATLEDPEFDGNLKSYHLRQMHHPYNTYLTHGLPPGPIAAAGREAMQAVSNPLACSDYFFVSMNNGKHVFCPTLECHEAAVQKWQIEYFRKKRAGK